MGYRMGFHSHGGTPEIDFRTSPFCRSTIFWGDNETIFLSTRCVYFLPDLLLDLAQMPKTGGVP